MVCCQDGLSDKAAAHRGFVLARDHRPCFVFLFVEACHLGALLFSSFDMKNSGTSRRPDAVDLPGVAAIGLCLRRVLAGE